MQHFKQLHHIAIICSNYEVSKHFYTKILGFEVLQEVYRAERQSYKLDLALNGNYLIELFSFLDVPKRPSRPEATGLRHIAFQVEKIEAAIAHLAAYHVVCEAIRVDEFTPKKIYFFCRPRRFADRII